MVIILYILKSSSRAIYRFSIRETYMQDNISMYKKKINCNGDGRQLGDMIIVASG